MYILDIHDAQIRRRCFSVTGLAEGPPGFIYKFRASFLCNMSKKYPAYYGYYYI